MTELKAIRIGDNPEGHLLNVVAVDTETTGLDWSDKLLGISLAWRDHLGKMCSCYYSILEGSQLSLDAEANKYKVVPLAFLNEWLHRVTVIGHFWPFDYRILYKTIDLEPLPKTMDTTVMGQMVKWCPSLSLDNMYQQFVGKKLNPFMKKMKSQRAKFKNLDLVTQAKYARGDAELTLELHEAILPLYQQQINPEIRQETMEFSQLVMAMCQRGLPINYQWIAQKKCEFRKRMMEIQVDFAKKGLKNLSSAKQVGSFLLMKEIPVTEETPTGRPKVDKEIIEELAKTYPILEGIVAFREYEKAIGSWLDDIKDMGSKDGRAHGILNPYGTRSFRIASSKINLQAIPLKDRNRAYGGFQGIFVEEDPEWRLYEIDIAQAEIRFASIIASESKLAEILASGDDPYINLSKRMWNTDKRRQDAKSAMLSSIYCVGYTAYANENNVSEEKAQNILTDFQRAFPKINRATRYWETFVTKKRYVPAPLGGKQRKVYFDPGDERTYRGFNQIVQTTVAEFVDRAMLRIENEFPGSIIHQMHDSIIFRVHKSEKDVILNRAKEIIENEVVPEWMLERTTPQVRIIAQIETWD